MTVQGHSKDIQIAEDGTLNEVEEEVAFATLPARVQEALAAKSGGAKITKVNRSKSRTNATRMRQQGSREQRRVRSRWVPTAANSLTRSEQRQPSWSATTPSDLGSPFYSLENGYRPSREKRLTKNRRLHLG